MYEKILFIFIFSFIFISCQSAKILPDDGRGIEQYREIQTDLRDGETELAITGTKLESTSEDIERGISQLESTSRQLEQSIGNSKTDEQELGEILRRIREREITREQLLEIGIDVDKIKKSEN